MKSPLASGPTAMLAALATTAVLTLCACSSGSTDIADATAGPAPSSASVSLTSTLTPPPVASTPTSASMTAATTQTETMIEAPNPVSPNPASPNPMSPSAVPDVLIPTVGTNAPTGQELYEQTCRQFVAAIDALEKTGVSDRQRSIDGISAQLTTSARWATLPPADQQEILRGLDAAGRGSC